MKKNGVDRTALRLHVRERSKSAHQLSRLPIDLVVYWFDFACETL
jgi:hypothetical protein